MCLNNESLFKVLLFVQEICKLSNTWAYSCITRTKKAADYTQAGHLL